MKVLINKCLRHVRYLSTLLYGGVQEGSISGIVTTGRSYSYHILQNNNNAVTNSLNFNCNPDFKTVICKRWSSLSTIAISDPIGATLADNGKTGPMAEYERRIASGEILAGDTFQLDAIKILQRVYEDLLENEDSCHLDKYKDSDKDTRHYGRGMWLWSTVLITKRSCFKVKGLYLYGGVGTGKTMLIDLFHDKLPSSWRKKRIHFHDFMLNVHSRLQMHKGVSDPLEVVAKEISDESILLCLDEFMVTDVADAMILNRLFRHLFNKGVVLVCTSNRAPDQLYEGGLQRDLFLPFIETVKERCLAHAIGSSTDYRKIGSTEQGFYFIGHKYNDYLKQKFLQLIGKDTPQPQIVEVVMGRKLKVPLGCNGCAFFSFEYLCDRPLGAADYFGLFRNFHTIILEGVPKFAAHNRTAAYRFITLVDVMYEKRARLVCTAEASPLELFEKIVTISDAEKIDNAKSSSQYEKREDVDLCVDNELGFAKDRTISRLTEMNSREYLELHEFNLSKAS